MRTFLAYQDFGLLPKPDRKLGKDGKGVPGYYNETIIRLIEKIQFLERKGMKLNEISARIGTRRII